MAEEILREALLGATGARLLNYKEVANRIRGARPELFYSPTQVIIRREGNSASAIEGKSKSLIAKAREHDVVLNAAITYIQNGGRILIVDSLEIFNTVYINSPFINIVSPYRTVIDIKADGITAFKIDKSGIGAGLEGLFIRGNSIGKIGIDAAFTTFGEAQLTLRDVLVTGFHQHCIFIKNTARIDMLNVEAHTVGEGGETILVQDTAHVSIANSKFTGDPISGTTPSNTARFLNISELNIVNSRFREGASSLVIGYTTRYATLSNINIDASRQYGLFIASGAGPAILLTNISIHNVSVEGVGLYDGIYNLTTNTVLGSNIEILDERTTKQMRYGINDVTGSGLWKNVRISGHTIAPINNVKVITGVGFQNHGVATITGDGTATDFLLGTHDLQPSITDPSQVAVMCTPANTEAINNSPIICYLSDEDADGIYESIRVKFNTAPALNAQAKIVWEVRYIG